MSRIGKKPIIVPEKVTVEILNNAFIAKGPKGEEAQSFDEKAVEVIIKDNIVTLEVITEEKSDRAKHGLYRSLFANCIEGVSNGFTKSLEIKGVGYKLAVSGQDINLALGYSHPVKHVLPKGVVGEIDKDNNLILHLKSNNKQKVGQEAARIRSYRKPEPYKGKGIRYVDEHITIKAGKSSAK